LTCKTLISPGKAVISITRKNLPVLVTSLVTLGSGLLNLFSVMNPAIPERREILREIFPLQFLHVSRSMTLLIGFALIIISINLMRRKKRALHLALLLSIFGVVFQLVKGLDYEEALVSLGLTVILWLTRKNFVVRSSIPDLREGLFRFGLAAVIALTYGVMGFWFLDPKDFGINFTIGDSLHRTLLFFSLVGDPGIQPHTHHARWFIDSLYLITVTVIVYAGILVFRPVVYRYRTFPLERKAASLIVSQYGRSTQDFFKYWPDKSFFFSESQKSFIAYRVGGRYALAMGDPVGPESEMEKIIKDFADMCRENDWAVGFHQALPDFLSIYTKLGFRKLKIGDDAIVDLNKENIDKNLLEKYHRFIQRLEKAGLHPFYYEPPIADEVLFRLKSVSDEWLQIQGRRERGFTLGSFDPDYLRTTPVFAILDHDEKIQAFVNIIPSFRKGETTCDLMRRRSDSHSGVMDYLFLKLFERQSQKGFTRFNLGMAPMAGFQEREKATPEERAIHFFFQHLNFLFSFKGLKAYKAKYATIWEPRYLIYRNPLDLPGLVMALSTVSAMKEEKEARQA
jgi:phosphatidylglycerol lysyltransferase